MVGDGSPIERKRSRCGGGGSGHAVGAAARRASHPQIPRRTPSRGRGRAAGAARARREARGGVGGGGGAGGGGHGAGARGWWRARHPCALRGRRSDSHACGQRRRVVRRAASRRARCARGRRALVGDRSPRRAGSERGAHWPVCAVPTLKSPSQTRKTNEVLVDNKPCSGRHQRAGRGRSCCASKSRRPSSRIVSSSCALTDGSARLLAGSAITVDGRQEDQRCAARRQTTTLAPARRGFLAARQMVSGRRWRHGRDELRGRHVAMRPSY